ncbi:MAG: tetratricopeptide repeat protein, partial [Terriglobales bacterium]
GFVLTHYFFEALKNFEDSPVGMRDAYPNLLREIFVDSERKRAEETEFGLQATPEVVRAAAPRQVLMLELAEDRLSRGDFRAAQRLAQQALDERREDPARALFILARAATLTGDMNGARAYFERSLGIAREPRMLAWSHIYLGRIFDLQENREAALRHYRAALAAGDTTPDTRAAAERGLEQAYQPPAPRR